MADDPRPLLGELSQLLGRYGFEERSRFVGDLAAGPLSEELWQTLAGLEFWGGSGAVWEMPQFDSLHPDAPGAAADYRRFQAIMVALSDLLDGRGLGGLSARTADLFRRLLGSDPGGP